MVSSKIFFLVIPLVFLIIVLVAFFGPESAWEELKSVISTVKDILPTVKVGLDVQKADVSIPAEHRAAIIQMADTINAMLKPGKKDCFSNYGKLPDLGEKGTSINFELSDSGDKTILTVRGGSGGDLVITDLRREFPGMAPCVIAGPDNAAEHFFDWFIKDGEKFGKDLVTSPYYTEVSWVNIFYGTSGNNGNRINMRDLPEGSVSGKSDNFENNGWIFTPNGKDICFFPTNFVYDTDFEGIDNNIFIEGEEDSIPHRVTLGKLDRCELI
ncbi:MAG: hypothetical protein AABX05_04470 [Nanoarchaeota archaeon]